MACILDVLDSRVCCAPPPTSRKQSPVGELETSENICMRALGSKSTNPLSSLELAIRVNFDSLTRGWWPYCSQNACGLLGPTCSEIQVT